MIRPIHLKVPLNLTDDPLILIFAPACIIQNPKWFFYALFFGTKIFTFDLALFDHICHRCWTCFFLVSYFFHIWTPPSLRILISYDTLKWNLRKFKKRPFLHARNVKKGRGSVCMPEGVWECVCAMQACLHGAHTHYHTPEGMHTLPRPFFYIKRVES